MKFAITARDDSKRALNLSQVIQEYLDSQNVEACLDSVIFDEGKKLEDIEPEFIIVVGGDGTILETVHRINSQSNPKIITVNMGTYGFLANLEPKSVISGIRKVLNKEYEVEKHTRILVDIEDLEDINNPILGLNDITVLTTDWTIREFTYFLNNHKAETIRSDGIVVSTPTGSTGYSMSANGPYLDPNVNALVINSLLPMNMNSSPLVVPDDFNITIEIKNRNEGIIIIDGVIKKRITSDKKIKISKSDEPVKFVRISDRYPRMINRIKERG